MSAVLLASSRPKARKNHRCETCTTTIPAGETYLNQRCVFDGRVYTYKSCALCVELDHYVIAWMGGWDDDGLNLDTVEEWAREAALSLSVDESQAAIDYLRRRGIGLEGETD